MRPFGGVPHDPAHTYTYANAPSQDTKFKHPSQVDMDYQLPKTGTMNERVHQWIAGRW
jgi:hypothetical protein